MKASTFIKVALIDQMQQIADLGLWFHLAKLIPSGAELLARVTERNENGGRLWYEGNAEGLSIPDNVPTWDFYKKYFPAGYYERDIYMAGSSFFSVVPKLWLTSDPSDADKHLQPIGEKKKWRVQPCFIHVPQWFEDFKNACGIVLLEIEGGKIEDIEVLKMLEQ